MNAGSAYLQNNGNKPGKMKNRTPLLLSIPLIVLLAIVSWAGLFTPGCYLKETPNWQIQSEGQDMVDLFFITPCLLISSILAYRRDRNASMVRAGIMLYLTYTFTLYCFDVHFNKLFVLYCSCLGLSLYSVIYFLLANHGEAKMCLENKLAARFIGTYFIVIAALFYFLWLSEIVPATVQNTVPKSVSATGLFTNGVQVLDLAAFLPAVLITGISLLKRKPLGLIFTPMILTFFVLMDITIGTLAVYMKTRGLESDFILGVLMGAFALVSLSLLMWYLKLLKPQPTNENVLEN